MLNKMNLNIYGIKINVESDNQYFVDIAQKNLNFFQQEPVHDALFSDKTLNVTFLSQKRVSADIDKKEFSKIGSGAYISKDTYVYFYGPLRVETILIGDRIDIFACYCNPKELKGLVKDLVLSTFLKSRRNYFLLIRYLILYPVFLLLEAERNIFLLHGSGVRLNEKGVAFAGLASVGKSLLSIALTLDHNAKFLTDNFLLVDEKCMYPFPEFLRLSDDAQKRIRNVADLGTPLLRRFKRDYYVFDQKDIAAPTAINVMFLPRISPETYVTKISRDTAIDQLLLSNDHVREFQQYHPAGLLNFILKRDGSAYVGRVNMLQRLLNNVDVYELGLGRSAFPADEVMRILHDVS